MDDEDRHNREGNDMCCYGILFCLFCAPLIPIIVILFLIRAYYKRQKISLKRYRELLTHDIRHPVRNGPAVVHNIVKLPPTVTWTVTCNRHRTQTGYCKEQYMVSHQWPNTELWTASIQEPSNVDVRTHARMTVVVKLVYPIPYEFANQLRLKERELNQQHLECDHSQLTIKRHANTVYRKYIMPDGYFTWWIPLAYWIHSLFLCSCCCTFGNNEVVYTIEKIYTGGRTTPRQAAAAVGTRRATANAAAVVGSRRVTPRGAAVVGTRRITPRGAAIMEIRRVTTGGAAVAGTRRVTRNESTRTNDNLPPSYQDFVEDPDKYQHPVPDQQHRLQNGITDSYGNSSNHGNIGLTVPPPSYSEYSKHSGHHIIIRLEEPSPAPSSVTYEEEITPGRNGGSPVNRSIQAANVPHLDLGHRTLPNLNNIDTLQSECQSETSVFTTSQSSNLGLRQYQTTQEITPNLNDEETCVSHL